MRISLDDRQNPKKQEYVNLLLRIASENLKEKVKTRGLQGSLHVATKALCLIVDSELKLDGQQLKSVVSNLKDCVRVISHPEEGIKVLIKLLKQGRIKSPEKLLTYMLLNMNVVNTEQLSSILAQLASITNNNRKDEVNFMLGRMTAEHLGYYYPINAKGLKSVVVSFSVNKYREKIHQYLQDIYIDYLHQKSFDKFLLVG